MADSTMIGTRVREARKRAGLTQQELARFAGVSVSLITKIEQGSYGGVRLATVHKLAVPLQVSTSALMSEPDAAKPDVGNVALWEEVREALEGVGDGCEPEEEPTIGGVRDGLNAAVSAALDSRYSELRVMLPALLRDANTLVALSASPAALARARQVRSQLRQLVGYMMGQTWQFEAAGHALDLAAADADDELTAMAAADWQTWILLRSGRLAECGQMAMRWADDFEPRLPKATPDELAAWGLFLIRVSNAAVRDNRPDDAREALRLARMAAAGVGQDVIPAFNPWQVFGPVTVSMFQAENAAIQGRPGLTLSIGAQVAGRPFPVPRNFLRHRLDVASACAATRDYGRAVGVLSEVRAAAPEWLSEQRYARDILTTVTTRRRHLTDEMRDLAVFLRLPL